MKRLLKGRLQAIWRWTRPLRRPLVRKMDSYFDRCLEPTERLLASGRLRDEETNLVMNYVVRELIHLQRQVETLQQTVDDLAYPAQGPAIARATEREDRSPRSGGPLKAG